MELRKYLMAGGFASVLVLGACGGDSAEEDTMEEETTMEEESMEETTMEDEVTTEQDTE